MRLLCCFVAAAAGVAAVAPPAAAQRPPEPGVRPPRLSFGAAVLGSRLPAPLVGGCGGPARAAGLGFGVGAGYRLARWLRAEGQLGGFGLPGGDGDCFASPLRGAPVAARLVGTPPARPQPPGTVTRDTLFAPDLAERRGFGQARFVAEVAANGAVLRLAGGGGALLGAGAPFVSGAAGVGQRLGGGAVLAAEVERWAFSFPVLDRTTVWEPRAAPSGETYGTPVTSDRRLRRPGRVTWLRVGVTVPLVGT
jgi:hypothetical protein